MKLGFDGVSGPFRQIEFAGIAMSVDDYKIVLYRQDDGAWVAEVPAIPGCYALMPTRTEALAELTLVFQMISEEPGTAL